MSEATFLRENGHCRHNQYLDDGLRILACFFFPWDLIESACDVAEELPNVWEM